MTTEPLFAIIVPIRNAAAKLAMTLQSICEQKFARFEVQVVDGVSSDETGEVFARFASDPRLRWNSEPDEGIYAAMNRGIGLTRARFLYFIGAGDSLMPNVLQEVATILPPPGKSLVYGNVLFADGTIYDRDFWPGKFKVRNICHQAIFYERILFEKERYDIKYPTWSDWVFNMKCFADRSINKLYIDKVIARYEGGGVSMVAPDPIFVAEYGRLVRRHLGLAQYLKFLAQRYRERWKTFAKRG